MSALLPTPSSAIRWLDIPEELPEHVITPATNE